jgi:hypothetical protein
VGGKSVALISRILNRGLDGCFARSVGNTLLDHLDEIFRRSDRMCIGIWEGEEDGKVDKVVFGDFMSWSFTPAVVKGNDYLLVRNNPQGNDQCFAVISSAHTW